jgi:hypothetical protein
MFGSFIKNQLMKKIVSLFIFTLMVTGVYSQAKSIYAELGGPGLASINFDTRFSKKEDGLGGRIGIGGLSIDGEGAVFVPIGLNYILGKDSRNYFEMGAGDFAETFGHILFGYRMQPKDGGFTFRAFINPVFGNGFFVPYYGGVSFGYKF